MIFRRINKTTVNCIVTPEDMHENGIRLDDLFYRDMLLRQKGYFPAYHISSGSSWISVLLDGTVPFQEICDLIDLSYEVTASKKKKQQMRLPKPFPHWPFLLAKGFLLCRRAQDRRLCQRILFRCG